MDTLNRGPSSRSSLYSASTSMADDQEGKKEEESVAGELIAQLIPEKSHQSGGEGERRRGEGKAALQK